MKAAILAGTGLVALVLVSIGLYGGETERSTQYSPVNQPSLYAEKAKVEAMNVDTLAATPIAPIEEKEISLEEASAEIRRIDEELEAGGYVQRQGELSLEERREVKRLLARRNQFFEMRIEKLLGES